MGKKHRSDDWDQSEGGSRKNRQNEVSQEELSEYIHVGRPGVLVVIIAMLVLLVAVIIWGFAGTLPVTETVTGLVIDADVYAQRYPDKARELTDMADERYLVICFVDASRFSGQAIRDFGDEALLKMPDQSTYEGAIETRYQAPVSMEEAKAILYDNDWVVEQCVKQNYSWMLLIRPTEDLSQYAFNLAEVTLLTEEVAPIRFLMK